MYTVPDFFIRCSARCVICTVPFDEQEEVALVTGLDEVHYEWTGVFGFPAAGATLKCALFSRNGTQREVRLCYNPFQCSSGSTFHLDCFSQSKDPKTSTIRHLRDIWEFSSWTRPWKTAPSLDDLEASQSVRYKPTEDEITCEDDFLRSLRAQLPAEILQEIMNMAYGSLLWKIFAARKWREGLSSLTGDQVTLPITDIQYWKRNQSGESANFVRRKSHFEKLFPGNNILAIQTEDTLTIAIDNLGIRSLEVLDSWPSAISQQAKCHEVYVVEKISNFDSRLILEKKGDHVRIQDIDALRLWDTPTPPPFYTCRFGGKETSLLRLKTIKLNTSLSGLSVFCSNGSTYSIHPHYQDDPSSVLDIFNQIPLRRRDTLLWLFCPLAQQQIEDIWLRHDSETILPSTSLVVRTTRNQIYMFGLHRNSGCDFQYLGSTPSYIVYESVVLGEEIPAFGIATESLLKLGEPPKACYSFSPPPDIDGLYCDSALLNGVQSVTSYCIGSHCVGIMIDYCDGLQRPLGQYRPDGHVVHKHNPVGFHHQSSTVGTRRKQTVEMVRLSTNQQEYQALAESGWESTKINDELKVIRLSWWCKSGYSFCDISHVK